MNMGHRILLPTAMCLTLGCGLPELFQHHQHHDPDPRIATLYDAPPIYAQWWATAESCAHKRENMQHLRWYAVASPWLEPEQRWENAQVDSLKYVLPDNNNIVYIRAGRTFDRTEVMTAMVVAKFMPYYSLDGPNRDGFQSILACAGISSASWRIWWQPNPP